MFSFLTFTVTGTLLLFESLFIKTGSTEVGVHTMLENSSNNSESSKLTLKRKTGNMV